MSPDDEPVPTKMLAALKSTLHLWGARVDDPFDAEWAAVNELMLSSGERARYRRYHREQDRYLFLVAHVMVRRVLSSYFDRQPAWWEFETNRYGRPEISNPDSPRDLRFNLSHTQGYVAMVVHDEIDAGVDVERTDRVRNLRRLATRVFAEPELAELLSMEPPALEERFYQLWTMKEAFIKAKGMGLAIPLDSFWFESHPDGSFAFKCQEDIDGEPQAWSFSLRQPTPLHVVATACRAGSGGRQVRVLPFLCDPPG